MLKMIDFSSEETAHENEKLFIVRAYFEYSQGDLAYDIDERKRLQKYFSA